MTYRERKQRRSRRSSGGRGALGLGLTMLVIVVGLAALAGVGWVFAVAASTPGLADLKKRNPGTTSEIFAADGTRLGFVQSDTLRQPISWTDMPQVLRDATVATEDESFYDHGGVDYEAIVRAGVTNVAEGGTVQGGSTITQQLARTLYIDNPERNLERKIREAKIALELEDEHSKEWILHQYLNSIPFGTVNGRTAVGIEAAAEIFFAKKAKNLTLPEAALLAGLPQAPSQYNPFQNPGAATSRRNEVLHAMAENGYLSEGEARSAQSADLGVKSTDKFEQRRESYFFDYVQQELIDEYGVETLRQGGLDVHTTIDPQLQVAGRNSINAILTDPAGPSSTVVAIDPSNGAVRAMASSGTYDERTFNLAAQGHRQAGSAFKTMVLTTAIREGIDPDSTYYTSKSPIQMNIPGYGPWEVETYSGSSGGNMSLLEATTQSDNTVYAQLIEDVGPEDVKETAELLGITSKLNGYPAEGLGGLEIGVSPLEMASAYATLASGGVRHEPHGIERVEFPDGEVDEFSDSEGERVLTDGEAYEVTKVLIQNVLGGTGTSADIGCPDGTAGKTGTTDEEHDAWFVGYTPALSTSVWVGYPDAQEPTGMAGGGPPAQIWGDFMAIANPACESFPEPNDPAVLESFNGGNTSGRDYETDTTTTETDTETDGRGGNGGAPPENLDPQFYEPPGSQGGGGGGAGPDGGGFPGARGDFGGQDPN
jgi:penicillin-binding protein 1A